MDKLKLDLDMLQVETFDALPAQDAAEGTVHGQQNSVNFCEITPGCSNRATCNNMTCNSCQDTTQVGGCFCTECQSCWCDVA